jgi:hypothetical protein
MSDKPTEQSKTPRTDALEAGMTTWTISDLGNTMRHARKLETELNEAMAEITTLQVHLADANKGARINAHINESLIKANNELKEQLAATRESALVEAAERLETQLQEEKNATYKRCPRCGDGHSPHDGCSCDWTGVGACGR